MSTQDTIHEAARGLQGKKPGVKSREALTMVRNLLDAPPLVRRKVLAGMSAQEMQYILLEAKRETGALYGLWHDTPSGFIEDIIGETLWSRQRQVLDSVAEFKRTIVPAGFGVGKTHGAGRLAAWFVATNPIGLAQVVTIAPRYRQVRNQLWPHIRTAQAKGQLPGKCDTVQWRADDDYGVNQLVAYGFSAPENDESAMQGVHAIKLLLIVDEAGGISKLIGEGTNNLLTGDAKMLAIGNPAMDDPGSWFETIANEGWGSEEPETNTVEIAVTHSPLITGEKTARCKICPPAWDPHPLAKHLPNSEWKDRTIRAYGEDHPYVVAKVYARFPKDSGARIISASWVENAQHAEDPEGPEYVRPAELGLEGESETFTVKKGAWVRLGVDVAADGGDEFVICRSVGDVASVRHVSKGAANANAVTVTEKVMEEIAAAERLAKALESKSRVRVKIDTIGVGWGVVGMLNTLGAQGKHNADIVAVNVSESPEVEDESAEMRPNRKRDEMWLAGRSLLQPDPRTGEGRIRLRVDEKTQAQLAVPNFGNNTQGRVVVESKANMRKRGRKSPDRAEALLMAFYEPFPIRRRKNRGIIAGWGAGEGSWGN